MTVQIESVDRIPVSQLTSRYNIARSNLYLRMKDLGIQVEKDSKLSYVNKEQLELLDALHEHINKGGKTSEFVTRLKASNTFDAHPLRNMNGNSLGQSTPYLDSPGLSRTIHPLPGQWIEVYDRITDLEKPLQFQQVPPSSPWDNYEQLDKIADRNWVIPTSRLLPLLGRKTIPKLDDHNRFHSHGFTFCKSGKMGNEYGWRVTKQQV